MTERLVGGLGVFTGEGHHLDDLLGSEGSRATGAGRIGEEGLEEPQQLGLGGPIGHGGVEGGQSVDPPFSPEANGLAMELELTGDLIVRLSVGRQTDDLEAAEQLLGGVLATDQMVEQLSLALRQWDGKSETAGHGSDSFHGQRVGRPWLSLLKFIPSRLWRRIPAALY